MDERCGIHVQVDAKALNGRATSSRKRSLDPQSARYDFRVFLLHLGLIGDEFKTARKHLIAALPGDSAFKRGRVKPDEQPAPKAETLMEAGPEILRFFPFPSRAAVQQAGPFFESPCSTARLHEGFRFDGSNFPQVGIRRKPDRTGPAKG